MTTHLPRSANLVVGREGAREFAQAVTTAKRGKALIIDRLGKDNAARLSAIVGGTRLHVPGRLDNAGRLKALLGDNLATLLVLHFGDSRFYVPVSHPAPKGSIDDRKVERLMRKGWSSARIARKLGCSERIIDRKRVTLRPALAKSINRAADQVSDT